MEVYNNCIMNWFSRRTQEKVVISVEETTRPVFSEEGLEQELIADREKKAAEAALKAKAEALDGQIKDAEMRRLLAEAEANKRKEEVLNEERRRKVLEEVQKQEQVQILRGLIAMLKLSERARREAQAEEAKLRAIRNQIQWKDKGFR